MSDVTSDDGNHIWRKGRGWVPINEDAEVAKDALIRELVSALKPFAEEEPEHEEISEDNELVAPRWLDATYGQYRAARAALAKAKEAGY